MSRRAGRAVRLTEGGAPALVGESGSGKSTVAGALLGLRRLRGARAAIVFQDPLPSLDPCYAIGDQIAEVYRAHTRASGRAARARAVEVWTAWASRTPPGAPARARTSSEAECASARSSPWRGPAHPVC